VTIVVEILFVQNDHVTKESYELLLHRSVSWSSRELKFEMAKTKKRCHGERMTCFRMNERNTRVQSLG
jgi:hypothetical protein